MPNPSPARMHDFEVISNEKIADGIFSLVISAPRLASALKPGQFVNIRVPGDPSELLRVPLSYVATDPERGTVEIWYAVVGKGTQRMSEWGRGFTSDLLGPGGHGWRVPEGARRVLVVGGGNSAFDEGLYLLNLGVAELTVVEIMDRFFAAEATQDALLGDPRVKGFKTTKVVDVEVTDGKLSAAILENAQTGERTALPVDGIFVFLGQSPNNEWFKDAIALDDKGYILAGEDMSTNIPGVFGAGDINHKPYRQITTAVSDGTIAALAAERWLRSRKK